MEFEPQDGTTTTTATGGTSWPAQQAHAQAVREADAIPRRARMEQWTPVERAIYEVMGQVEALGADVRLTDAVTLLGAARASVADYVDGVEGVRRNLTVEQA